MITACVHNQINSNSLLVGWEADAAAIVSDQRQDTSLSGPQNMYSKPMIGGRQSIQIPSIVDDANAQGGQELAKPPQAEALPPTAAKMKKMKPP